MGGYHLVHYLYQHGLKQEMRSYLQTHADTRYGTYLSFPLTNNEVADADFEWEEENGEFRYKNEWYDVVTVERTGGELRLYAFKDVRENDLEKQVNEIRHAQHSSRSHMIPKFKFFSAFCNMDETAQEMVSSQSGFRPPVFAEDFLAADKEVASPPPRLVA